MSLLTEAMTPCTMLMKSVISDGYGGYSSSWEEGLQFDAAIVFDKSVQVRASEVQGVTNCYTVTVSRSFVLKFHDVFRRETDGKIFRVTSDGNDSFTPVSAALDMRQVMAEEWKLPNE